MKFSKCKLDGILTIEPDIHSDSRGFFLETYKKKIFQDFGIADNFVQDNHSRSNKNTLRGLHFTVNKPQSQIVTVIRGKIFDVVVDIRKNSSTFGQWFGIVLSCEGVRQIYMPHGFAHGFCVLSEWADLHYKVSQYYDSKDEDGLKWNDVDVNIQWPTNNPIISIKDKNNKTLKDI